MYMGSKLLILGGVTNFVLVGYFLWISPINALALANLSGTFSTIFIPTVVGLVAIATSVFLSKNEFTKFTDRIWLAIPFIVCVLLGMIGIIYFDGAGLAMLTLPLLAFPFFFPRNRIKT